MQQRRLEGTRTTQQDGLTRLAVCLLPRNPAWGGFLSYAGRYDVDEAAGTVTHHIEMCHYPNWVGEDQVRHFQLDGSMIELTAPPIAYGGDHPVAALVWERA